MKCISCAGDVEEERIDLLKSTICSKCAHDGIGQEAISKAAVIYLPDGTTEISIMDGKTFDEFERARKARANAHL